MEKRVFIKDEYTNEQFIPGKGVRLFHLYCDRCGVRHPDKCVNHLYPEEGYPKEMDLCHDCQEKIYKPELEDPTESVFFSKAYDLDKEGLQFKSDFNFKYQILDHLLEVRTMRGYLKIDQVFFKKAKRFLISVRIVDFSKNVAKSTFYPLNYEDTL